MLKHCSGSHKIIIKTTIMFEWKLRHSTQVRSTKWKSIQRCKRKARLKIQKKKNYKSPECYRGVITDHFNETKSTSHFNLLRPFSLLGAELKLWNILKTFCKHTKWWKWPFQWRVGASQATKGIKQLVDVDYMFTLYRWNIGLIQLISSINLPMVLWHSRIGSLSKM